MEAAFALRQKLYVKTVKRANSFGMLMKRVRTKITKDIVNLFKEGEKRFPIYTGVW